MIYVVISSDKDEKFHTEITVCFLVPFDMTVLGPHQPHECQNKWGGGDGFLIIPGISETFPKYREMKYRKVKEWKLIYIKLTQIKLKCIKININKINAQ